jgi:hypothetical protein
MPGVHAHRQESENTNKREFAEGHQFGMVSAIAVSGTYSRSIPLVSGMQESKTKTGKDSLVEQMVNQAGSVLPYIDKPGLLVLDAYYCKSSTFKVAERFKNENGTSGLTIITRAAKDTTGYTEPAPRIPGQRGATRIYGESVKLYSLFKSAADEFTESEIFLYGKKQKVRYLCKNLIWKPLREPKGPVQFIRFVLVEVVGSDKRAVLMCNDLNLAPEAIIKAYGLRFKIETGFDDLKNDLGCFNYHFWSKSLPKKKKWKDIEMPVDDKALENISKTRQAIEMHVASCCIAYGILSIIGFSYNRDIWGAFSGWLRTIRSPIPSIATTRNAFAQLFHANLASLTQLPVFSLIYSRRRAVQEFLDVG